MNARSRAMAAALLALMLESIAGPSGSAPAQGAARQDPAEAVDSERSGLLRGWLAEVLYRDQDAAVRQYETSADSADAPGDHRAIALARLLEIARLRGRDRDVRRYAARLREFIEVPPRVSRLSLQLPRAEFEDALGLPPGPDRDAKLSRLRQQVADTRLPAQRIVPFVVQELRREESAAVQKLRQQIAAARQSGDRDRVAELRRQQLRGLSPSLRAAEQNRVRRLWVLITKKHLQGQHREAERYHRVLLGARFRPRPLPSDSPPAQLLAQARGELRRILRESDLLREEREVLEALAARLATLAAAGQTAEALTLLAQIPYRLLP